MTVTSSLGSMCLRAAFDHDHRAVVEIADALAGVLAGLDHTDPKVLARQQRGLHRVRERVHVQDADALEVGDAVEVQVVRQDRAAVALRERDELRIDLGVPGDVLVDDLDRRRAGLAHAGEDLEAATAAGPPHRNRSCREALDLVEDEPGHLEDPVEEPGVGDVGDPAVDDRARVDEDPGHVAALPARRDMADDAQRLGGADEVVALRDGQADHREAEEDRDPERRDRADRRREVRQRQADEQPQQQAEEQADDRGHELGGRQLLHRRQRPHAPG